MAYSTIHTVTDTEQIQLKTEKQNETEYIYMDVCSKPIARLAPKTHLASLYETVTSLYMIPIAIARP